MYTSPYLVPITAVLADKWAYQRYLANNRDYQIKGYKEFIAEYHANLKLVK